MHKLAATLGILATTLTLGIAMPTSAQAATGTLYLNDVPFQNPTGCIRIPGEGFPRVDNQTNATLFAYPNTNCTGRASNAILPGKKVGFNSAKSVLVMDSVAW